MHGIFFQCNSLCKKDDFSSSPILSCLEEIKAWMAQNLLDFDKKQTKVMVFGPGGLSISHPVFLSKAISLEFGYSIGEGF